MSNHSKQLVTGTIIIFLFLVLSSLVGYGLKFFMSRTVSVEKIGLFYSVLGLFTFFLFMRDLGLSDSLPYFIPRFLVEGLRGKVKSGILFTLSVQLMISITFSILISVFAGILARYYFKNPDAVLLVVAFAIYFVIDGINEVLYRVFHGYQNMFLNQAIEFFFQFVSSVLIVACILLGLPVRVFGWGYVIASVATAAVFLIIFLRRIFPDFISAKYRIDHPLKKEMIDYSLPTMISNLADQFFSQQSIFFLTLFVGLESVGYYILAMSLAKITVYLFKSMNLVFMPMLSELWKKKEIGMINFYFNEIISYSYLVAFPASLTLIFFSDEVLRLFYGNAFVQISTILKLYAIYYLIFNYISFLKSVFLSAGLPRIARNITYLNLAANLVLNLVLIPWLGLLGAAIADLSSVAISLGYSFYLQEKTLPTRISFRYPIRIALASLAYLITVVVLKRLINLNVLLEMTLILIISAVVYVFLVFKLDVISLKKIDNLVRQATNNRLTIYFFSHADELAGQSSGKNP